MTEKRTTPGAGRRTKRAAPTIDLKATEVPAAAREPAQENVQEPVQEPIQQEPIEKAAAEAPHPASAEPAAASADHARPTADAPSSESPSGLRGYINGPALAAGFAGAALMTMFLFGLWLTGLVPIRYAGSTATRARVAALEMEVHALQSRPATAVDTKAIDGLTARVNAMQETIAKLPAGGAGNDIALAERVTAADNAMKSLGLALTALTKRGDDIAANAAQARERAEAAEKAVTELRSSVQIATTAAAGLSSSDMDALQKRIAGLEQATKAARDDIAKTGASDAAARLALSAAALRDAVVSGAPFAPSLAQAKSLGADANVLAALEPFAANGLPSSAALAQELRALLPGMIKKPATTASGGFLEKLQANAGNLVRVRPVGAPAGDDSAAVLARVESAAAVADIAAALTELGKLPETTRAPAQAWIAKVNARQAALAAARTLVAETARSLGSK
jgi:hypothetical protein